MDFDDINLTDLPANAQEAFSKYEKQVRNIYERQTRDDQDHNRDQNGQYFGDYDPERAYVTAILAFVDEYEIDLELEGILHLGGQAFIESFKTFKSEVQYVTMRYDLRKARIGSGSIGTLIEIDLDYKSEIGDHLGKIRRIVNQKVEAGPKKDSIFSKISSLQSEVDRDQTTVDAAFGRILDLGKTLGQAGEAIEPAVAQLERIKKLFWDKSEKVPQLPKKERPKLITKDDPPAFRNDLDDEIPF